MEVNPLNAQVEAQENMEKYGVKMEAWAPFGEGRNGLFENEVLTSIGKKYNKYSAQSHTEAVAKKIAANLNADMFEIVPKDVYTSADLN